MRVEPDLAADNRPAEHGGIDLGDGLEVIWETDYAKESQFYHGLEISKQEFLEQVRGFSGKTEALIFAAFGQAVQIACAPDLLSQHAAAMRELFVESGDVGLPPYECKDVAQRFGDVMALADNAFIYAAKSLSEPANGGWPVLLESSLKDYRKSMDRLGYELEKVK